MATTNVKILLRRGLRKEIGADTLETGEMGFAYDTNQLYIGIDDAINEIRFDPFANAQAIVQSWLDSSDNPEPGLKIDEDLVIRQVVDVPALLDAMNFFTQTITFDTTTQTFTPGDTLNQKYNKTLADPAVFEMFETGEILSSTVTATNTEVTVKVPETGEGFREVKSFTTTINDQATPLSTIEVTDALNLTDRFYIPNTVNIDNGVDAEYTLTLDTDYTYVWDEVNKKVTISFTTPIVDGKVQQEQVSATDIIVADGDATFNLLNYPTDAPSSVVVKDANANVLTTPADYTITVGTPVSTIEFVTAPTVDITVEYNENVDVDENSLVDTIKVNFSDNGTFKYETVDGSDVVTDLASLTTTGISGSSDLRVSQYGGARRNVEVVTENSFNQMFADQHLESLDATTGLRSSLFKKELKTTAGTFLRYSKNDCTSFFIDYSLKQTNTVNTYVRVGQIKVINGVPQGINKVKLSDDNTEIWQDDGDNIADADEFSNITFSSEIDGEEIKFNYTQDAGYETEISFTVKRWTM